jgi:hypothetical protein
MATELQLILLFKDYPPYAEDLEELLDCEVLEYHESEVE